MCIIEKYENYSASDYYDAVTLYPDKASEAVYYLLKHRLSRALGKVFELHGFGLEDHYDDTIDDFFLYLYDHGEDRPFSVFDTIREKQAFFGWTVGSYRHFLLNKAREEVKRREMMEEAGRNAGEEERPFANEILMRFIATAIAFADQELPPHKLFIFYRMLLSILDQRLAVPQEEMARAMGMHPVTYRVYVNRMRMRLSNDVTALEKGQELPLDSVHLLMRNRLFRRFDHLYEMLIPYYEASIQSLSTSFEINELRNVFAHDGIVMHEDPKYSYPHVVDVRELYNSLKS